MLETAILVDESESGKFSCANHATSTNKSVIDSNRARGVWPQNVQTSVCMRRSRGSATMIETWKKALWQTAMR
jgi:hypothetical protein